ncbi:MAG: AAA family ATPase [Lentisphaerae bacterium]|nr:AAA family ATPase [Lentisphaerota bacterium]
MSVSSLPPNLASDLAKANVLSIHLTAGIELDDEGQPVRGAAPFTQTCEYRIDGDAFMRLARTERRGDFLLSQLNREHVVFEPILQAMLLSSRTQQSLNEEDSELLAKLVDTIVPKIRFQGDSDFLPGTEFDPDLLAQMDRSIPREGDAGDFGKLGDLGRSVRLFLPRTLLRFHAGVQEALTRSLESLSYLGPLRSYPPRHLMAMPEIDPNWIAGGGSAWRDIMEKPDVREKIDKWLSDDTKLKTPYRLELDPLYTLRGMDVALRWGAIASITTALQAIIDADFVHSENFEELKAFRDRLSDWDLPIGSPEYDTIVDEETGKLVEYLGDFIDWDEYAEQYIAEQIRTSARPAAADVVLIDQRTNTEVSHRDVGIGISQVLPVLAAAFGSSRRIYAIEQPEIHLHPALQAELGDVFIESSLGEQQNRFVLETHSEHLILRILRRIRETSAGKNDATPAITPDDVALLYVEPDGQGSRVLNLRADKRGRLMDRCPGGFFEEDFEELF